MEKQILVTYDLPVKWIWTGTTITHTYLSRALKKEFDKIRKDFFKDIETDEGYRIKNIFLTNKFGLNEAISELEKLSSEPISYTDLLSEKFTRFKKDLLKKEWKKLTKNGRKKSVSLIAKLFFYHILTNEKMLLTFNINVKLPNRKEFREFLDEMMVQGRLR